MHVPAWPGLSPSHFLRPPAPSLPFPLSAPDKVFFYVARNGIYHLFRELAERRDGAVLMPDYHSGNEVWAARAAGVPVRFYRVNRRLEPDIDQIAEMAADGPLAVYLIHFIGWPQPVEEILELCRERDILLIEDCALSLLSESSGRPLGSFGDYSVYCLYKTLPVPNGGLLVGERDIIDEVRRVELRRTSRMSVAGRTAELGLEWLRKVAEPVGQALFDLKRGVGRSLSRMQVERTPVGDIGFELDNVDLGMSSFCHRLLERFDYETIRARRRDNFFLMRELLDGVATPLRSDLDGGVCPLFFPILVRDKQEAAKHLWAAGIDAVQFWNYGDEEAQQDRSTDAQFLRDHVLELPIHQDIDERQIRYTAGVVGELGSPFPATPQAAARPMGAAARAPAPAPTIEDAAAAASAIATVADPPGEIS